MLFHNILSGCRIIRNWLILRGISVECTRRLLNKISSLQGFRPALHIHESSCFFKLRVWDIPFYRPFFVQLIMAGDLKRGPLIRKPVHSRINESDGEVVR